MPKLFENSKKIITNMNVYILMKKSYGCIIGTHARDKDGIVAVMALCEAACYYKQKGITLMGCYE